MCESKVILKKSSGEEEVIMEEASVVKYVGKKIVVVNLIGENIELNADIREVDLMGHKIILFEK